MRTLTVFNVFQHSIRHLWQAIVTWSPEIRWAMWLERLHHLANRNLYLMAWINYSEKVSYLLNSNMTEYNNQHTLCFFSIWTIKEKIWYNLCIIHQYIHSKTQRLHVCSARALTQNAVNNGISLDPASAMHVLANNTQCVLNKLNQ